MREELKIMQDREVWVLEKTPLHIEPLGCRWVFTLKRNEKGDIVRYKARLVAQGYKQIKGESYDETFSPVVNFGVIRFFFSLLIAFKGWSHIQCDIKCAYLYAPLKETIYMTQPPGFSTKGKESYLCKLNKALYGLHQSGRAWYFEINKILSNIGFNKLEWCNCVYLFQNDIILLLYVDDMVLLSKNETSIHKVFDLLNEHFDLTILGKTKKLLGVEFEGEKDSLRIHQLMYIEEMCERFGEFNFPISSLPIAKGSVYSKSQCPQTSTEIEEMQHFPYRNLLGCLSFLANRTRPDIAYATNVFSQFQSNPGLTHWNGLLKLLGYVSSTRHLKLKLNCNNVQLIAYTDADFAANRDDRTSMGGQLIFLDKSPIMWRTFKQQSVSLSTMESEFIAMTETSKELLWYDRILNECHEKEIFNDSKLKSLLYVDNMATIDFIKSPIENHRTKHIDVKLFFIRDLYFKDVFEIKHIRSKENLADPFTKPLTQFDMKRFQCSIFV